ncbi:hypothetical protein RJT34_03511 [Clitoria ternatea]|uniref:Dof-type domain-containing protein n=1 Tax=Clitoria ternatea TaxID=43366 RepID=A0AAN9KN42_CLITE
MAQLQSGQDGQGIKLFGTTIALHRVEEKEDKKDKKPDKIIPCPRCKSLETKFCYFNNYNVNQPRHFCKGCQRSWTAGGALRDVPVGAGRRKAKPRDCGIAGIPDGGICGTSTVQQFDLEKGLVLDEWCVATVACGDFRQLFASKRQRTSSGGRQPC